LTFIRVKAPGIWRISNHDIAGDEVFMADDGSGAAAHGSGLLRSSGKNGISALIMDPKTIRLFYHVHPKGP